MLIRYPQHSIPLIPPSGSSSTFGVGLAELARIDDGRVHRVSETTQAVQVPAVGTSQVATFTGIMYKQMTYAIENCIQND